MPAAMFVFRNTAIRSFFSMALKYQIELISRILTFDCSIFEVHFFELIILFYNNFSKFGLNYILCIDLCKLQLLL